ncbi:bestrophin family ion channel [Myxococcaceae bacterium GXIMD 01537]
MAPPALRNRIHLSRAQSRRERAFWSHAMAWHGSVTPLVLPRVLLFLVYGLLVGLLHEYFGWEALGAVPAQFTGAVLVLLLVLRTNSGYERWWEARRLWGGIVNQSRNLAIAGVMYGPASAGWREDFVRWTVAFCHTSRRTLRGERELPELVPLLRSRAVAERVARAQHMPTFVSLRLAHLLREAMDHGGMDRLAFFSAEEQRAQLIDHVGGCERILKTPLPLIHTIKLRRFLVLYLLWLPFAAVGDLWWLPGLLTGLVAYPLLATDEIAAELENPFSPRNLSHLPLDELCRTIEGNLLALVERPSEVDASLHA